VSQGTDLHLVSTQNHNFTHRSRTGFVDTMYNHGVNPHTTHRQSCRTLCHETVSQAARHLTKKEASSVTEATSQLAVSRLLAQSLCLGLAQAPIVIVSTQRCS
jgi:hypothetical protein